MIVVVTVALVCEAAVAVTMLYLFMRSESWPTTSQSQNTEAWPLKFPLIPQFDPLTNHALHVHMHTCTPSHRNVLCLMVPHMRWTQDPCHGELWKSRLKRAVIKSEESFCDQRLVVNSSLWPMSHISPADGRFHPSSNLKGFFYMHFCCWLLEARIRE